MTTGQSKPIIGILGGIGSGKSTVAERLGKLGCAVINADALAKSLLENAEVKTQLRQAFGSGVFNSAGNVDKKALAKLAFEKKDTVETLNAIIHPKVYEKTEHLIKQYQTEKDVKAIVLDIPLLTETGWDKRCDKIIFVDCNEPLRLERTEKRGNVSLNELKKREKFQISLDKKANLAHYIVRNEADLSELDNQIGQIFPGLVSKD